MVVRLRCQLHQHRRQQGQFVLVQIPGNGDRQCIHRRGKGQWVRNLRSSSHHPLLFYVRPFLFQPRFTALRLIWLAGCGSMGNTVSFSPPSHKSQQHVLFLPVPLPQQRPVHPALLLPRLPDIAGQQPAHP